MLITELKNIMRTVQDVNPMPGGALAFVLHFMYYLKPISRIKFASI